MRRLIHILAAVLIVQVVLAVVLDRAGPDLSPSASDTPMIVLDGKPITRLVIDGIDSQVTLEKKIRPLGHSSHQQFFSRSGQGHRIDQQVEVHQAQLACEHQCGITRAFPRG